MRTVREPTSYRVGNTRFSVRRPYLAMALLTACLLFYLVLFHETPSSSKPSHSPTSPLTSHELAESAQFNRYNSAYPLSAPRRSQTHTEFRVALIADMDTNSKKEDSFVSYLLRARIRIANDRRSVTYTPESGGAAELHSAYAYGDRGMELSELVVFNGKLYTCDDRTGIVYEVLLREKLLEWLESHSTLTEISPAEPEGTGEAAAGEQPALGAE
jgi:soluble calcium-activated nucleotidase 1